MSTRAAAWGVAAAVAILAAYFFWALSGWIGEANGCLPDGNCYCEAASSNGVVLAKQPANTLSAFVPVLVGLYILLIADRSRRSGNPNPMLGGGLYPVAYGALVMFLGFGSMAFHGSLTRFGGWLDTLSMILFVVGLLVYTVARVLRVDDRERLVATLFVGAGGVLAGATWLLDGSGIWAFAVLVAATVLLELAVSAFGIRGLRRAPVPWLLLTLATFAVALAIWFLYWDGGLLCQPTSLLQGHAIWHLLAMAVVPFLIFRYLQTETRDS